MSIDISSIFYGNVPTVAEWQALFQQCASSGVNDDITQLTALTTVPDIIQAAINEYVGVTGSTTTDSLTTAAGSDETITLTNANFAASAYIFAVIAGGSNTGGIPQIVGVTSYDGYAEVIIHNFGDTAFNGTFKITYAAPVVSLADDTITINGVTVALGGSVNITTQTASGLKNSADITADITASSDDVNLTFRVDTTTAAAAITVTVDPTLGSVDYLYHIVVERSTADTGGYPIIIADNSANVVAAIVSPASESSVPSLDVFADGTQITCRGNI